MNTPDTRPGKPTPDFPLFAHGNGQWAKKVRGKLHYYGPWADPQAALSKYLAECGQTPISVPSAPRPAKPSKPRPDFPLYAHASGQWAKKVRGKTHFFGPWADPEAALEKWVDQKDALLAGRAPARSTDGLTVRDLANAFLIHKQERVTTGELKDSTFLDYRKICDQVVAVISEDRLVADLRPDDFAKLRKAFAKGRGLVSLYNGITRARVLFKYAADTYNIPVAYGKEFAKPDKKSLRKARREKGRRMFQSADLRKIIDGAGDQLKAMLLLGINCGFGNTDVGTLPLKAIDLEKGWVDYPRTKTEIHRRCPLWPETIEALQAAIAARHKPAPAFAKRVFITSKGGAWEPRTNLEGKLWHDDPIAKETAKLLKKLGLHRPGLGFYALRHTFQTIGEKSRDKDAVRYIMGHAPMANDMSATYNEEAPEDARLSAVADYVHDWLFPSVVNPGNRRRVNWFRRGRSILPLRKEGFKIGRADTPQRPSALFCCHVERAQLARPNPSQHLVGFDAKLLGDFGRG